MGGVLGEINGVVSHQFREKVVCGWEQNLARAMKLWRKTAQQPWKRGASPSPFETARLMTQPVCLFWPRETDFRHLNVHQICRNPLQQPQERHAHFSRKGVPLRCWLSGAMSQTLWCASQGDFLGDTVLWVWRLHNLRSKYNSQIERRLGALTEADETILPKFLEPISVLSDFSNHSVSLWTKGRLEFRQLPR